MRGVLDRPEPLQEEPGDLAGEGRLVRHQVGHLDPEARGDDRLVGPALGREGDPGRAGDEDEARPRVGRVQQRVEAAGKEAVVEGPDGKERATRQLRSEAEHGQEHEERRLPDPQLDVLPLS